MIAKTILEGWRKNAPWPLLSQVEQDLIISRALVELYNIDSNYFRGSTKIMAIHTEEMIGTKFRALYQRSKGRDLFDLFQVSKTKVLFQVSKTKVDWSNIVSSFKKKLNIGASQKDFISNLEEKMKDQNFLTDMTPLLSDGVKYNIEEAYEWFLQEIIPRMG